MALIQCTKCGGQVSDSANVCPHCGYDFSEEAKEFSRLSEGKKRTLRREYDVVNPRYAAVEEKDRKLHKAEIILVVIFLIGDMIFLTIGTVCEFDESKMWAIILYILFFCALMAICVALIVVVVNKKKTKREILKELKRFQTWLRIEKKLDYHVVLSQKEKYIFDEIEI